MVVPVAWATDAVRVTVAPWLACVGEAVNVVVVEMIVGAVVLTVTDTAVEVEPANVESPE